MLHLFVVLILRAFWKEIVLCGHSGKISGFFMDDQKEEIFSMMITKRRRRGYKEIKNTGKIKKRLTFTCDSEIFDQRFTLTFTPKTSTLSKVKIKRKE
jgi:hypothetical protein